MLSRSFRAAILGAACLGVVAGCVMLRPAPSPQPIAERLQRDHLARLDTLVAAVDALAAEAAAQRPRDELRAAFIVARRAWKHVEALVEHFTPATSELINGPVLVEMEENDLHRVIEPEGFQVVEELLHADSLDHGRLAAEVRRMRASILRAQRDAVASRLTDAAVFDAARQELVRIAVLGLAGFDSPIAGRSVPEATDAMQGIRLLMTPYVDAARARGLDDPLAIEPALAAATAAIDTTIAFDGFDRLGFIVNGVRPLAAAMMELQRLLAIPMPEESRLWRASSATPFEPDAFDALFFAPAESRSQLPGEAALGEALFAERDLSLGGTRSCATCHQPERGFADSLRRSNGRNAPTLTYAALQGASFHDMRVMSLEDQIAEVLGTPAEMHRSLDDATAAIARRADIRARFGAVHGDTITPHRVRRAIAAYVRTLQSFDSPFDRHVRGDTGAMSADARAGFNVFMGKGKCGTCHFAPLFNGVVPPGYQKTESEVLGVPATATRRHAALDRDLGRAGATRLATHRHAFKTPTLRNVARTAPYMHNGAFDTLEEVVDFYDGGGGRGLGLDVPNQTLPPDSLRLTPAEKRQLIRFMEALTDRPAPRLGRASDDSSTGTRSP